MSLGRQLGHFVVVRPEDEVRGPAEVLRLDILRRDREFKAVALHRSHVAVA